MNGVFDFLTTIRWQDILDIALNTYILLRIYVLFRETRIFRLLLGIAFLWFFQEITVSLGFIVTSLVIRGIMAVSAFIVIVVFSDDIRSVFRAKNLKAVLWGFPRKTVHAPVEIIADSVYEMAQKYCGSLIVFPGKDDLRDILKNGIRWEGLVSKEMILSIFWYGNPVHDGAIIIQDNCVTEVGVILPLSARRLPASYGTRHRAAAGLTERTDALVLIVSEERGKVLLAKGSEMDVMSGREELKQKLRERWGVYETQKGLLNRENFQSCMATLFSFLLAAGIWFLFARGEMITKTFSVPLAYVDLDSGLKMTNSPIAGAKVHVRGSDLLVKSVKSEQIRIKVDISNAIIGYNTFRITKENISLPPGILLEKVEPEYVRIEIDTPTKLSIPIQFENLDPTMEIVESSAPAVRLYLTGSDKVLESLRPEHIRLSINMEKATAGSNILSIENKNIVLPQGIVLKKIEPAYTEVTLGKLAFREVPVQADWVGKLDRDLILTRITLHPDKIRVMGNPRILENLSTLYTEKISLDKIKQSGEVAAKLISDTHLKIDPESESGIRIRYVVEERGRDTAGSG